MILNILWRYVNDFWPCHQSHFLKQITGILVTWGAPLNMRCSAQPQNIWPLVDLGLPKWSVAPIKMTVSYTPSVGTATKFGAFGKVLLMWVFAIYEVHFAILIFCFRWQGSLYKLTFPGLFLYLAVYYSISFMYRFVLNQEQRTYVNYLDYLSIL